MTFRLQCSRVIGVAAFLLCATLGEHTTPSAEQDSSSALVTTYVAQNALQTSCPAACSDRSLCRVADDYADLSGQSRDNPVCYHYCSKHSWCGTGSNGNSMRTNCCGCAPPGFNYATISSYNGQCTSAPLQTSCPAACSDSSLCRVGGDYAHNSGQNTYNPVCYHYCSIHDWCGMGDDHFNSMSTNCCGCAPPGFDYAMNGQCMENPTPARTASTITAKTTAPVLESTLISFMTITMAPLPTSARSPPSTTEFPLQSLASVLASATGEPDAAGTTVQGTITLTVTSALLFASDPQVRVAIKAAVAAVLSGVDSSDVTIIRMELLRRRLSFTRGWVQMEIVIAVPADQDAAMVSDTLGRATSTTMTAAIVTALDDAGVDAEHFAPQVQAAVVQPNSPMHGDQSLESWDSISFGVESVSGLSRLPRFVVLVLIIWRGALSM